MLTAYALSATLAHVITALVALAFGDETPKNNGWLSPNPLNHMNMIGGVFIILLGIPLYTSFVPVIPMQYDDEDRWKLGCIYLSQCVVYFFLALIAFSLLMLRLGEPAIQLAAAAYLRECAPLTIIAEMYPDKSTLEMLGILLLIAIIIYNIIITPLSLIVSTFRFILSQRRHALLLEQYELHLWIGLIIFIVLFDQVLRSMLILCITWLVKYIGYFYGVIDKV